MYYVLLISAKIRPNWDWNTDYDDGLFDTGLS